MDHHDNPQDAVEFVCEGCGVQFGDVPENAWTCDECEETFCGAEGGDCEAAQVVPAEVCEHCHGEC